MLKGKSLEERNGRQDWKLGAAAHSLRGEFSRRGDSVTAAPEQTRFWDRNVAMRAGPGQKRHVGAKSLNFIQRGKGSR